MVIRALSPYPDGEFSFSSVVLLPLPLSSVTFFLSSVLANSTGLHPSKPLSILSFTVFVDCSLNYNPYLYSIFSFEERRQMKCCVQIQNSCPSQGETLRVLGKEEMNSSVNLKVNSWPLLFQGNSISNSSNRTSREVE